MNFGKCVVSKNKVFKYEIDRNSFNRYRQQVKNGKKKKRVFIN